MCSYHCPTCARHAVRTYQDDDVVGDPPAALCKALGPSHRAQGDGCVQHVNSRKQIRRCTCRPATLFATSQERDVVVRAVNVSRAS
ncbi:hypothetical protein HBI56_200170 [Parastagonospora nodorum]|uniref:Uncharacterized protein n=1 Tax=Phaeosphaeria nodorum (strain SN15 / ATCC MYA-4574 / FGSC 10173) TaxID=321614 RepID=A0A7U2EZC7_PHANO|nr:hypothetical protein HBH56_214710 [Parastagonospora nodorum]QRC93785.1 hypothetical protein JI435_404510 [Parastagonospora nodorum SN15]KAH3922657.1 hypothetical protein HBH54_222790 [Parastagonospora nodorum]KAH3942166.1 hypothetical protein HBH53_192700 [Parastagonospora nodorum]KAH3961320.1 hypothetical protein HBH51_183400 [Parastagonospora nodorum]